MCKPLLLHVVRPPSPGAESPPGLHSDFSEDELVQATHLLHGDLEGVFVGVVLDDVVVHVD